MALNPRNLAPGNGQYEWYNSALCGRHVPRVQYDYRAMDGTLFSTVAKTLEEARDRKNQWVLKRIIVGK